MRLDKNKKYAKRQWASNKKNAGLCIAYHPYFREWYYEDINGSNPSIVPETRLLDNTLEEVITKHGKIVFLSSDTSDEYTKTDLLLMLDRHGVKQSDIVCDFERLGERVGNSVPGFIKGDTYRIIGAWLGSSWRKSDINYMVIDNTGKVRKSCSNKAFKIIGENQNKGNSMKNVDYIGGEFNVVSVVYLSGDYSTYNFKIDADRAVEIGDTVVVDSKNGLGLCKVENILENNMTNAKEVGKATAWVVDVVDMKRHQEKITATERLSYIKEELNRRSEQVEIIKMYQLLAEVDPESKKLVEEMKTLVNLSPSK